jgi:DDE family transposase
MSIEILTEQILNKIPQIGKWRRKFILHLFPLWFSLRGRYNFVHLARYGVHVEDTYRNNFALPFDFLTFNQKLVEQTLSSYRILAFDPVFIPKSGKHTPGVGYFYSGCAGREKWGLEFSGIAAIDLSDKTALHLKAIQTMEHSNSLLEYYASHITTNAEQLKSISKVLAADAFFAKAPFINALADAGFDVVTRLRKDAVLRYLYHGPKRCGRGRPKTFDGRIDPLHLRADQFTICAKAEDGSWLAYESVVNVKAWKRNVRLTVEHTLDQNGQVKSYKLYVCANPQMPGHEVKYAYSCRFQIEFLYRDAKQHAGLNQCQARSEEKLYFHLNTALTCVSLAKAAYHIPAPLEQRKPFSMADIKNASANDFIFNRIISLFGFNPNSTKIKHFRENIRNFGKIAA